MCLAKMHIDGLLSLVCYRLSNKVLNPQLPPKAAATLWMALGVCLMVGDSLSV